MKFHLLLFLFLANVFKANSNCKIEIQSLLNKADKEFREIRYLESLKSANKALAISKKNQISQSITDANISVAKALLEIGVYKQGLNYLIDAEKQPYFKTSIHYIIEVARLRGRAYANLKIYKLSLQEFQKQLTFSKKLDDKQERYRYIFLAHQNLSVLFQRQNQMDSLQKHLALQESLLKQFNEKQASIMLSTTYVQKAEERILNKDYKKAGIYLNNSLAILKKYNIRYLHYTFEVMGDLENFKGNKKKAIYFYDKAYENARELNDYATINHLNKVIGDYLTKNDMDPARANNYLFNYQKGHDSIETENQKAIEIALDEILSKNKIEHEQTIDIYIYIIISISVLALLFVFFYYSRKKQNRSLLDQQIKIIDENENLKISLEDVNSKKIEELISLAKSNSPEFLILFKELYPEYIFKLTTLDPQIRNSEIQFCAFAYLNFSTKEISQYTFVTVRAVQIRRNRLRKKYNIQSDIDFNHWMHTLGTDKV